MLETRISAEEAAKRLGIDVVTLRGALIKELYPFGKAIRCKKTWRYVIVRERFDAYMNAADIKQAG